jgi:hypothetical protein
MVAFEFCCDRTETRALKTQPVKNPDCGFRNSLRRNW